MNIHIDLYILYIIMYYYVLCIIYILYLCIYMYIYIYMQMYILYMYINQYPSFKNLTDNLGIIG